MLPNLVRMVCGIKRHSHATGCDDPEISCHPPRMVVGKDGYSRPRRYAVGEQPGGKRLRHPTQFRVGVALDSLSPLDFNRYILRPAFGALDKSLVKGRHWLGELYSKTASIPRQGAEPRFLLTRLPSKGRLRRLNSIAGGGRLGWRSPQEHAWGKPIKNTLVGGR